MSSLLTNKQPAICHHLSKASDSHLKSLSSRIQDVTSGACSTLPSLALLHTIHVQGDAAPPEGNIMSGPSASQTTSRQDAIAAIVNKWFTSQRDGWLRDFYGTPTADGTKILSEKSVQYSCLSGIRDFLLAQASAVETASKIASSILSEQDVGTPYNNLWGMYFAAIARVSPIQGDDGDDEEEDNDHLLQKLVDLVVALARLGAAVNTTAHAQTVHEGNQIQHFQPGETLKVEDKVIWTDLPSWSLNLTERIQGPAPGLRGEKLRTAKQVHRNMHAYMALLVRDKEANKVPVLTYCLRSGIVALSIALEYSAAGDRVYAQVAELWLPAVEPWLCRTREQLEAVCVRETEWRPAGDLWVAEGGSDTCDVARLRFWQRRYAELKGAVDG